jgi:hypothetical protein
MEFHGLGLPRMTIVTAYEGSCVMHIVLMRRIFTIVAITTVVNLALPIVVLAASSRPVISQLAVSPTSLPSGGGTVQATATVSNARGCDYEVSSYAATFGKSTKISAGACDYTFSVPANDSATTMYVAVTLSVSNLNIFGVGALQQVTISVAPNISSVTSTSTTSTTFPKTSGSAVTVPAGPDALLVVGPHIWVASCTGNAVTEIEAATRQVIQDINGSQYGFVCPRSLALVDGDIWVADYENNSITVISASTGALVQTLAGPGIVSPVDIVFTGSEVWVTGEYNGLSEFRPSGAFIGGVHGGPLLSPSSVASTGADIWVVSPMFHRMAEYNARTGAYLKSSQASDRPGYVSYHGGILWLSEDSGNDPLDEFSASSGKIVRVVANADSGGILLFDGRALFAECRLGDVESVREYSPTGKFVKTLISLRTQHSTGPFLAMALDGNYLWVANYFGQSIDVLPVN